MEITADSITSQDVYKRQVLMKNSGAWGNSGLRRETPDALRAYMDAQPKEKLKDCRRIMNELTSQYGFQAAASAMEMACTRGSINTVSYTHLDVYKRQI